MKSRQNYFVWILCYCSSKLFCNFSEVTAGRIRHVVVGRTSLHKTGPNITECFQAQVKSKSSDGRLSCCVQTLSTNLPDDWPRAPSASPLSDSPNTSCSSPPASLTLPAPPLPGRRASAPRPGALAKDGARLRRRTFLLRVSVCSPNLWPQSTC